MESWQSGNAPDSKSGEPAYTGAQVQILYSPLNLISVSSMNLINRRIDGVFLLLKMIMND